MLKLKLQYFGHLMLRADLFEKTRCWERLGAGGEGDNRGRDGWMVSPTQWTWVWENSGSWWWTAGLACCVIHGVAKIQTRLRGLTELNCILFFLDSTYKQYQKIFVFLSVLLHSVWQSLSPSMLLLMALFFFYFYFLWLSTIMLTSSLSVPLLMVI